MKVKTRKSLRRLMALLLCLCIALPGSALTVLADELIPDETVSQEVELAEPEPVEDGFEEDLAEEQPVIELPEGDPELEDELIDDETVVQDVEPTEPAPEEDDPAEAPAWERPVIELPKGDPELEELFGEGAMYLDDFLAENPNAKVFGLKGIAPTAIGTDGAIVDPGWFDAAVTLIGDTTTEWGPYSLSENGSKTTLWQATQTGGELEALQVEDVSWSGFKSGTLSWNELGFLESGYPKVSNTAGTRDYGITSITLGNTKIYQLGVLTLNGDTYLWVTADAENYDNPVGAVVVGKDVKEMLTLHYEAEEFTVAYEV